MTSRITNDPFLGDKTDESIRLERGSKGASAPEDTELVTLVDEVRLQGTSTADGPQDQSHCGWAKPTSWRDIPPAEKFREQQPIREGKH